MTSEPTGRLTSVATDWFTANGVENVATVSQIIAQPPDKRILAVLQKGIDKVNDCAISRAQFIQKWTVLVTDFSLSGGELGKLHLPISNLVL